jgi:hypothetical protein
MIRDVWGRGWGWEVGFSVMDVGAEVFGPAMLYRISILSFCHGGIISEGVDRKRGIYR